VIVREKHRSPEQARAITKRHSAGLPVWLSRYQRLPVDHRDGARSLIQITVSFRRHSLVARG